jgi:NitT/TauT family transport system substrate-binding protein
VGPEREISISVSQHLSVAVAHLAEESGYFRQAGIRLKKLSLRVPQAVPLLAGGKLDVALGGLGANLVNVVLRGMSTQVVAGRERANPDCGEPFSLYAHRGVFDTEEIDLRRLRGRRFSVRRHGIADFILDIFLADIGLSRDDIECVDLSLQESMAALSSRKVDALFDLEFSQSPLAASPDIVRVWRFAEALPGHQYSFVLFGDSMLKEDLQVGARFLAAYLKAAQEYQEGRTPEFLREFAAQHKLDEQSIVSACRDTYPTDGSIDLPSIQRMVDWYVSRGLATEPLPASRLVDTRFLELAQRLLASGSWQVSG